MPASRTKRKQRKDVKKHSFYQEQLRNRRAREEYVRKVSFTGNVHIPFFDDKHYNAAMRYIETGIESLKVQFPSKVRR